MFPIITGNSKPVTVNYIDKLFLVSLKRPHNIFPRVGDKLQGKKIHRVWFLLWLWVRFFLFILKLREDIKNLLVNTVHPTLYLLLFVLLRPDS